MEVNRQFFHPLGLALAITVNEDGDAVGLAGIIDMRGEEDGVIYDPSQIDGDMLKKHENVIGEQRRRAEIRQARLGFVVQPLKNQPPPAPNPKPVNTLTS